MAQGVKAVEIDPDAVGCLVFANEPDNAHTGQTTVGAVVGRQRDKLRTVTGEHGLGIDVPEDRSSQRALVESVRQLRVASNIGVPGRPPYPRLRREAARQPVFSQPGQPLDQLQPAGCRHLARQRQVGLRDERQRREAYDSACFQRS